MNIKSTQVGKYIIILITLTLTIFAGHAQTVSPKLRFVQPKLVSGVDGEKNAIYKFSDVIIGIDAFVKIMELKNGARLVNIDDSTFGYYDAWQPTVGGPSTPGLSYIKWEISFKTTSGSDYTFPLIDLSAIDIDGDNVRVREFIDMMTNSTYDLPASIPSLLSITSLDNEDDENNAQDDNAAGNIGNSFVRVLGPVLNRTNIDTVSLDVRINFHFINPSIITLSTGSQVDNNGTTGGIATDRFNSLYFKSISNIVNVLGVKYRSFDAYAINNSEINITWTTENETHNDHFEIERSFDQNHFSTVALVFGPEENTSASNKYSFTDKAKDFSHYKIIYYRLKQIDIDGKVTYSVVKTVRFNTGTQALVEVFPNPYMEKLNVNFKSEENGKAEIRMINANGQVVSAKQSLVSAGYNTIRLTDLASQVKGLYFLDIIINGKLVASQKVIKQ